MLMRFNFALTMRPILIELIAFILFYSFCFINSNNSCCVIMPAFVIGATILFGKVK